MDPYILTVGYFVLHPQNNHTVWPTAETLREGK